MCFKLPASVAYAAGALDVVGGLDVEACDAAGGPGVVACGAAEGHEALAADLAAGDADPGLASSSVARSDPDRLGLHRKTLYRGDVLSRYI